jgi:glycine/D-amino acid oxidase-like deaminating enzyme
MSEKIADVLVVGAGLMGCATAYELAKAGISVIVAEKNAEPGLETTSRSGAIIRAHYGVPELVELALDANKRFARFTGDVGYDCGFVNSGYGVIVDSDDADTLQNAVAMHKSIGVNVSFITPGEFADLVPGLKTDDIALVAYEPDGGFASPSMTVSAYTKRATEMGASFLYDRPVTAAEKSGTGWLVALSDGSTVSAGSVIICTGNWSKPVGRYFGLDLPVTPVRAQIVVVERANTMQGTFPVVSDLINLAYFRADGETGMWVGSSDMADLMEKLDVPEDYRVAVDPSAVSAALTKLELRFSGVDSTDKGAVQRAFCGLYETTPDWQPIIDSPATNLHVAVGFSGHGFKLAPVIGEAMSRRVSGQPDLHDMSIFNMGRFASGKTISSRYPYRRARFLR